MNERLAVRPVPAVAAPPVAALVRPVLVGLLAWAGTAVPLVAAVRDPERGVDAMDESHYLLAAQPWASASGFDGVFGWYLGALLRLLGDDVARLRVVAALVLVVVSLPAARAVRRAAERATGAAWPPELRAAWPAAVASGSLCFYVVFVRTPAYNWFAEVGLLLVATGLAAFVVPAPGAATRGAVVRAAVPLGAGLAVTAMGKTTSALGALVVVCAAAAALAALHLTPSRWVRRVLAATGAVLVLATALHLTLVNDLGTTLTALRRAAGAVASVDPDRYTPAGVVEGAVHGVWDVLAGSPGPLAVWAALPLLAVLATDRPDRDRQLWLLGLTLPGLVLPLLLLTRGYPGGVEGLAPAAGPPAVAFTTAMAAALVAAAWYLPGGIDRRLVLLGAGLGGLALCVPLGTNVPYATQTPAATGLFACAAAALLAAAPARVRVPALGALVAVVVLLAAMTVPTSRARAPYRIPPLEQNVVPRDVVPGAAPLLVDPDTARWIDDLRAAAAGAGWQRGTPLLDLTWHPMSVLALDGRAPATLLPAFPGWRSEVNSTIYALEQDLEWSRRAWILVPAAQPVQDTDAALAVIGRSLTTDYEFAGRVTAPFDRQQQDLWRPRQGPAAVSAP